MNKIKSRLGAQKGASITFALLIFLVCAVVSSIVVVAGSTAAGRMSQMAQTDQRYYAVTSAAELLRAAIDGQAVTVVKKKEYTTVKKYGPDNVEGVVTSGPTENSGETKTWVFREAVSGLTEDQLEMRTDNVTTETFLIGIAKSMATEPQPSTQNTVLPPEPSDPLPVSTQIPPIELTASGTINVPEGKTFTSKEALDALKVTLYLEQGENGMLTFYVSKMQDSEKSIKNAYTLKLTFATDKQDNVVFQKKYGAPIPTGTDNEYTIEETETVIATTVTKWSLIDIEKSAVPAKFLS